MRGLRFFSVLLCALAGGSAGSAEPLLDYLHTRDTEVDFDGDGVPDEIRRLDARGRIVYLESRLPGGERRTVQIQPVGMKEQRREEWYRGSQLVRTIEEIQTREGRLERRSTQWGTRRREEGFFGGKRVVREFRLENQKWVLAGESTRSAVNRELAVWDEYLDCRASRDTLTPAQVEACRRDLDARLSAALGDAIRLDAALPPSCENDRTLYLTNSMRIDLASCAPPNSAGSARVRTLLEEASKTVTGGLMACLGRLNPRFSRVLASAVSERMTRIQCGGTTAGRTSIQKDWCGSGKDDATRKCVAHLDSEFGQSDAAAIQFIDHPSDVTLLGFDPNSAGRFFPSEADQVRVLGSTLFHEMLHSVGHYGYHDHNTFGALESVPKTDDVLGCSAVCGAEVQGPTSDLSQNLHATRENCLACVRSSEPAPDDHDNPGTRVSEGSEPSSSAEAKACGKYPTAAEVRGHLKHHYLVKRTEACLKELGQGASWGSFRGFTQKAGACEGVRCLSCAYLAKDSTFMAGCDPKKSLKPCLEESLVRFKKDYRASFDALELRYPFAAKLWEQYQKP